MKLKQTDKTIFLVDDVVENLHLLTQLLSESGYRIRTAQTGNEAIESILTEVPDLILMDVKLPDINGFEVCKRLKNDKRARHIPVIFLSGLSETADKIEGFSVGGVDYITKPFISEEVIIRIRTHIEMSSLRMELESRTNELLKTHTEDFKELFDRAPVGYHEIDTDGRIVRINETELEMLGYSSAEVIGEHFWKFAADEALSQRAIAAKLTGKSREAGSYERDFRKKDGTVVSFLVADKILEAADGRIIGIRSNVQDITERKHLEKELRESEEQLKFALSGANDGIWDVDMKTNSVYMSPRGCEILGYEPDRLHEIVSQWNQLVHPDDMAETNAALMAYFEGKTPIFDIEQRLRMATGDWKWIHTRGKAVAYSSTNKPLRMVGTHTDITDHKLAEEALRKSEEKFRNIFEYSIVGKSITTFDGQLSVNKAFSNIVGYSEEELNKLTWRDITYEDDIELKEKEIELLVKGIKKFTKFESRFVHKNGSIVWADFSVVLQRDNDGNPLYFITTINDITERKVAEDKLRRNYDLLNKLTAQVPGVVYQYRLYPDGRSVFPYSSEGMYNIYEVTPEDVCKDASLVFTRIHPDDYDYIVETITESARNQTKYHSEFRVILPKQGIRWRMCDATPELLDDGSTLWHGIISDITERKQIEIALQETNERLNLILENNPIALWDWDVKTDKWFATQKYYTMLGYEPEDRNPDRKVWLKRIHPDDREYVRLKIENILNHRDEHYAYDARMLHADGTYRWHTVMGQVIEKDSEGNATHLIGVRIDINDRKQTENKLRESEEKLSTLFSSMTEMVVIHELVFNEDDKAVDYRIIDCNNAFTRTMGIPREEAIGRLASEVYQTKVPPYFEIYVQVATTGKAYEYDSYYAPMDKYFIISVVSPRKNVFATITTDISAMKQIQDEITAKNKELENYLYVASHDLRSPLVNIQGFSQRLQKQSNEIKSLLSDCKIDSGKRESFDRITNEAIPKTLNFILSNVLKMDSLINSLLQISRTGRVPLMVKKVDMNELMKTIIAAQNYQLTELSAQVIVRDLSGCFGDANQLNQLFSNLIDNAIKYRDKSRQLVIEIDSKVTFGKVTYSVSDTGKGIAPRNMEKIWDVFYRVDASAAAGEGIGLSIAKTITSKHKGKIWVESEEHKGSTFYVELQLNEFSDQ